MEKKCLSFEGRGVLIRVVAQAIPTYIMSCFLLPKGLCDKIESAVCSFWWGGSDTKRKVHWPKKDTLFRSKDEGGMGFKTLREFNLAMLARQVWRLHTNPTSLIAQCYKAKYYPNLDGLQASIGHNPSFAWRSIHQAIWVIKRGSCWRMCSWAKVNIWDDNWIPTMPAHKILTLKLVISNINTVQDIIQGTTDQWDKGKINSTFLSIDRIHIDQIPLINVSSEDKLMWMKEKNGNYTVKRGYQVIIS